MLGWLHEDGLPIEGLKDGDTCPVDPKDPSKGEFAFIQSLFIQSIHSSLCEYIVIGTLKITRGGYDQGPDDPLHDFDNVQTQINGGLMNGFVSDAKIYGHNASNPISMFDTTSAPIINTLAKEYAVFDHWFCSIPGPTGE